MKVGIIDYGVGNIGSVINALEDLRCEPILIKNPSDLALADAYILPGVGGFSNSMKLLEKDGWVIGIQDEILGVGKPILGICLGMQLLASFGNEWGDGVSQAGLGLIPGRVEGLRELGCKLRVPHVGWNEVSCVSESGGLFAGISDETDFYFVHSYMFVPDDKHHILASCNYDITITAAVRSGKIWGVQFHPEKSSRAGFRLLKNFLEHS
tara:strand:- start:126 stop:755 length:630 start_codon:yes stop_codon:yes gene_type:complete